ncbi:hypothetical protein CI610_01643 [invertebrate metagenome]|uniref:Uncharacterized protein n=1 Tax=invertebrate metagenome TaxID=1711999 RepID=A0A2H9T839_9ZZZZ
MDIEEKAQQQLDNSQATIQKARIAIDDMAQLMNKIHVKKGAGHRYLDKIKPNEATLKSVEKRLNEQNSPSKAKKGKSSKKKNLLKAMHQRGKI